MKVKKFTTRKWGFGSNIVNFIKSASFCKQNNYTLFFQDRHNSISEKFELFSVVDLPTSIIRFDNLKTYPIEDLKSLIKFLYTSDENIFLRIYYFLMYLFHCKNDVFIKNFNSDKEINKYFKTNILNLRNGTISSIWKYNQATLTHFNDLNLIHDLADYIPDISMQIRGGDKNKERIEQGFSENNLDLYYDLLVKKIIEFENKPIKVYLMTDTFYYFKIIKERLMILFPQVELRSLVKENHEGYDQNSFNNLDAITKINNYYFFLYELEILKSSKICIGSFNSNIFYLAYITGNPENNFFSVDSSFDNNFL